jgi:hypothetical protein
LTTNRFKNAIHPVGSTRLKSWQQVRIRVERNLDVSMSESLLNDLWMLTLQQQQRGNSNPTNKGDFTFAIFVAIRRSPL